MKRCPKCESTYSDETLSFCLTDGASLVPVDENKTDVIGAAERREIRIDLSESGQVTQSVESPATEIQRKSERRGGAGFLLGFLAFLLSVLLLGASALAVYFIVFAGDSNEIKQKPEPTADRELESLKKRLAELQSELDENGKPLSAPKEKPDTSKAPDLPGTGNALVNSPLDGFLALRTIPNHKTGSRIAKIPHGANVAIKSCRSTKVKIGRRSGRWCLVTYKNMNGWVFDAWLRR